MAKLFFLDPETMSPLHVQSKVYMAPFHVRSKVCIATFYVRNKVCKFGPHLDGSNANFGPHMEGRHSFRDQKIAKIALSANFHKFYFNTTYIFRVDMNYLTTFKNNNILRENTFNQFFFLCFESNNVFGQGVPHGPAVRPAGVAQAGAAVLGGGGRGPLAGANLRSQQLQETI